MVATVGGAGMNWLDIIITVVLCWSLWRGLRIGLLAGSARLVGLLAGLLAAFCYYKPLARFVEGKWHLGTLIHSKLIWPNFSLAPVKLGEFFSAIKFPDINLSAYGELLPHIAVEGKLKEVGEAFSKLLASGLLEICSFIIIFLVISFIVAMLGRLLGMALSFSIFGIIDRLGGAAFGLARGLILVFILLAVAVSLQWPAAVITGGHNPLWLADALKNSSMAPLFLKILLIYKFDIPGFPQETFI
jgi:membrane protein required for colicin V production